MVEGGEEWLKEGGVVEGGEEWLSGLFIFENKKNYG